MKKETSVDKKKGRGGKKYRHCFQSIEIYFVFSHADLYFIYPFSPRKSQLSNQIFRNFTKPRVRAVRKKWGKKSLKKSHQVKGKTHSAFANMFCVLLMIGFLETGIFHNWCHNFNFHIAFRKNFPSPLFRLQLITPANALSQHIHTLSIYSSEKGVPTALIFESLEQPPLHVIMNKGVRVREREFCELRSFSVISWKKRALKNVFICKVVKKFSHRNGVATWNWLKVVLEGARESFSVPRNQVFSSFRDVHHR